MPLHQNFQQGDQEEALNPYCCSSIFLTHLWRNHYQDLQLDSYKEEQSVVPIFTDAILFCKQNSCQVFNKIGLGGQNKDL